MKKHIKSFRNALDGLGWTFSTQRNFRVHFTLSVLSLVAGWFFHISNGEFLVIFVLIIMGLVIETINTAIEETIDAIHKDWSSAIKIAKDVSAASMLLFAIGATLIAAYIFIPKILLFLGL